jgi:hypothetical protein
MKIYLAESHLAHDDTWFHLREREPNSYEVGSESDLCLIFPLVLITMLSAGEISCQ